MPQGQRKQKNKLPSGMKTKSKKQNKPMGVRKGGREIAPKKARHIEAAKLRKGLEKSINASNEHDITMKANSVEPKSFHLHDLVKAKVKDSSASGSNKA